jgi:VIT1/CCC1 family predicted Fe2+/Mn2+ transporter
LPPFSNRVRNTVVVVVSVVWAVSAIAGVVSALVWDRDVFNEWIGMAMLGTLGAVLGPNALRGFRK